MAQSRASKMQLVVFAPDGSRKTVPAALAAEFQWGSGMKVALVDAQSGRVAQGLTARRAGGELLLESPELDGAVNLGVLDQSLDVRVASELVGASVSAPAAGFVEHYAAATPGVATTSDAGGGAAPVAASSSSLLAGGSGMVWVGVGALAALGMGGGGGGGGGLGGLAIDGYLQGATVTRANGSGNSVLTDANGRFSGLTGTGPIKVVGGTDASTGQPFKGVLTAPEGATVVTPVTTLIEKLTSTGQSLQAATQTVTSKLGLPASFDLLKADPVALAQQGDAQALQVFKAGVMVATALQVIAGGDAAQFANAANALVSVLNASSSSLTGADLLVSVLDDVVAASGSSVAADSVASLTTALAVIDTVTSPGEVAGTQASVLNQTLAYASTGNAFTFKVAVDAQAKAVSFDGNASGPITVRIDAQGTATFLRSGVIGTDAGGSQAVSVPKFADEAGFYKLNVPAGARLIADMAGSGADDVIAVSAANAVQVALAGSLGGGQDSVLIKIDDRADDVRILTVDTRALAGAERVAFDFADVKDKVILTADSYLANIGTIEVKKGTTDFHQVDIPAGTVFVVNSGLTLTLEQFLASESISSVTGLGRLTLLVDSASGLSTLTAEALAKVSLIGFGADESGFVEIRLGEAQGTILFSTNPDVSVASPNAAAVAAVAAIEAASLPSIPTLVAQVEQLTLEARTAIEGLQDSLDSLAIADIAGLSTELANLKTATQALQAADTTLDTRLGAVEAKLAGVATTVTSVVTTAVDALETKLLAGVGTDFDTLKEVATELGALKTAITALGAATDTRLNALEAKVEGITTTVTAAITTAVDGLETKLLAGVGTDFDTLKEVATELASLKASITALDTATGTRLDALEARADAVGAAIATAVTTAVDDLKASLLDGVDVSLDTFKEVAAKLSLLQGAIDTLHGSGAGSVATSISNAIGAPTEGATAATGLWAGIESALNSAIANLRDALKDGVSSNYDTFSEVAAKLGSLQSAIDTLNGSGAGSVSATIATAVGAPTSGSTAATGLFVQVESLISAAQASLTSQINALDTAVKGAGWTDATYQTLASLSDQIVLLKDAAGVPGSVANSIATAVGAPTSGSTAATGLFVQVESLISAAQASLTSQINALDTAVKGAGWTDSTYQTLASVSDQIVLLKDAAGVPGSVANSIATAVGAPTSGSTAATGLFVQVESLISAAQASLTSQINALDTAVKGAGWTDATYQTLASLSNQIVLLKDAADVSGSVANSIKGLSDSINETISSLKAVLAGRGAELSVEHAGEIQTSDPLGLLVNYRIVDSLTHVSGLSSSSDAYKNAKSVVVASGTLTSATEAAKLIELKVNLAESSYDVEQTVSALTTYSGAGAWPVAVLNAAKDVTATGTATFSQALTLLQLTNTGDTSIESVSLNYSQVAALPVGANDTIGEVHVTGLNVSGLAALIDFSGYSAGTKIYFAGGKGDETVIATRGAADDSGLIDFSGGAGSDQLVIIALDGDARVLTADDRLQGGAGLDTLHIVGTIDLSQVGTLSGFETLYMELGSPSRVTLTTSQLLSFSTVTGSTDEDVPSNSSVIQIADATIDEGAPRVLVDLTAKSLVDIAKFEVGANVTLKVNVEQFQSIGQIVTGDNATVGVDLDGVLLHRDLDISALTLDPDYAAIDIDVGGFGLVLTEAQANGASLTGIGTVRIVDLVGTVSDDSLDLGDVAGSLEVTAVIEDTEANVDLTANTFIAGKVDRFEVAAGATLKVTSTQVSAKVVEALSEDSAGSLIVELESDVDFNLSGIDAQAISTQAVVSSAVTLHASADLGTFVETLVEDEASLTLSADQATSQTITASGSGEIDVTGATAVDAYDFAGITAEVTAGVTVHYTTGGELNEDTNWGEAGQLVIDIADGQTLVLSATQASGQFIEGAGSVTVNALGEETNLSHITAGGTLAAKVAADLAFGGDLGTFDVQVAAGATLTIDGDDVTSLSVTGDTATADAAGGSIVITGLDTEGETAYDFAAITAGGVDGAGEAGFVRIDIAANTQLASGTDLGEASIDVADAKTLTLSAGQATLRDVHGAGSVLVTGLQSDTDLVDVTVGGSKTVTVTSNLEFTGDLGMDFTVEVGGDFTLTGASSVLSGQTIQGAGAVTVTALATDADLDGITAAGGLTIELSQDVTLSDAATLGHTALTVSGPHTLDVTAVLDDNFDLTPADVVTVGEGATLVMTASQADTLVGAGAGTIAVTALESALEADLSSLDAADLNVAASVGATGNSVAFIGKLGSADVSITGEGGTLDLTGLAQIDPDATFNVGAATTLKVNASDVSGKTVSGTGSLQVIDLEAGTNLSAVGAAGGSDTEYVSTVYGEPKYVHRVSLEDHYGSTVDIYLKSLTEETDTVISLKNAAGEEVSFDDDSNIYGYNSVLSGVDIGEGYYLEVSYYSMGADLGAAFLGSQLEVRFANSGADEIAVNSGQPVTVDFHGAALAAVEAVVAAGGVDITSNENLGGVTTYTVKSGRSLTLDASQAADKTIAGDGDASGSVTVKSLEGTPAADLSGIHADMDATVEVDSTGNVTLTANLGTIDTVAITGDGTVTLADGAVVGMSTYTVGAGSTLSLSAADADAIGTITASGTGEVDVTGATAVDAYDFAGITAEATAGVTVHYTTGGELNEDTSWGEAGQLVIDIADGQTLVLSATQASGQFIEGAGSVTVTGLTNATDLAHITVLGDKTVVVTADLELQPGASLGSFSVTVDDAATLTLAAAQASGVNITVEDGASLDINSLEDVGDANLATITGAGTVTAYVGDNVDFSGSLGQAQVQVSAGATFSAAAEKVSGQYIAGAGNVSVTGLEEATNLAHITAGGTLQVTVTGDIDFMGDLGSNFAVTIEGGKTLSATLDKLSGQTIGGEGSVKVTALTGTVTAALDAVTATGGVELALTGDTTLNSGSSLGHTDLTVTGGHQLDVTAASLALTADDTITVPSGNTLKMTATQADDLVATGRGTIELTAVESALDADLSNLGVDTLNASASISGTIQFAGNLGHAHLTLETSGSGEFDVTGAAIGAAASFSVGAGVTLRIDSADVNRTIDGTGYLAIENLTGDIDLDGLAVGVAPPQPINGFVDTFAFDQWTITQNNDALVTFNQNEQTLTLTGSSAEGMLDNGTGAQIDAVGLAGGGATVTVHFEFTQRGQEFFRYRDQDGSWQTITASGSGDLELSADYLLFAIGSDEPDWGTPPTASTLVISNFVYTPAGGTPGLQAVSATVTDELVDISSNTTGADKISTFDVQAGSTLKLSATQADGSTINQVGDGNEAGVVQVVGLEGKLDADLSGLNDSLSTSATLALTDGDSLQLSANLTHVDIIQIVGPDSGSGTVTLVDDATVQAASYTVGSGATLSLGAADASAIHTITASGTGMIDVTGASASSEYDFSGLTAGARDNVVVHYTTGGVLADATNWGNAGQLTIEVSNGCTLTLTAAQASGQYLQGAGTANLSTEILTQDVDLTHTTATLNFGGAATGSLDVGEYTLTINARQLGTLNFTGSGTVKVMDFAADSDLSRVLASNVTAMVATDLSIVDSANLGTVDTYSVASSKTLTMSTSQTSGVTLSGPGTVLLADSGTFDGTIDTATVKIAQDHTVTIDASLASARTVAGVAGSSGHTGGSIVVSNLDGSATYNLAGLTAGAANGGTAGTVKATIAADTTLDTSTALGALALIVQDGVADVTLTLTAAQATSRSITGDGGVYVNHASVGTAYDFTQIQVSDTTPGTATITVEFTDAGSVSGSTQFGGVDVIRLASGETTLSAAQADGIVFTGSAAGARVHITGSAGNQSIVGTAGDDVIDTGGYFANSGSGQDSVDISQGGHDTVSFTSATKVDIVGFKTTNSVAYPDDSDILDFAGLASSLSGTGFKTLSTTDSDLSMGAEVIALTDVVGNAAAIATQFAQYGNIVAGGILNSKVDPNQTKVFIADSGDTGNNVHSNIWLWADAAASGGNGDGDVQAGELHLLGALEGLSKTDLALLTNSNFVV